MAVDIGPRIGIDGEKQFRDELKNINQSLKTLDSEMKVVKSSFDGQKKSAEQLKKENEVLERSVLTLKDKLSQQEDALEKCARKYGEADAKTMKWQQAVNETRAALNNTKNAIIENNNAINNYGKEIDNVSGKTTVLGDVFKGTFAGFAGAAGITTALNVLKDIAVALKDAVVSAAEYADEINTMSAQTGLSTKELQEFKYMSELIDVDLDTLTGSMSKLIRSMSSVRKGTGSAAAAFEKLGISVTNNDGILRSNTEVFAEVIESLGQIEDVTERDALAMDIFGKSAQDLNPLILAGADALAQYRNEIDGMLLTDEELDNLNTFNDDLYKLKTKVEDLKLKIIAENIDEIESILSAISSLVDGLPGFINTVKDTIAPLVTALNPLLSTLRTIADLIGYISDSGGAAIANSTASVSGKKVASGKKLAASSSTINVYTQTMTKGQTDYMISAANRSLGGKL